jgi:methylase of polypeptide subunit release factors
MKQNTELSKALPPSKSGPGLRILELGTGCGIVGITLAQSLPDAELLLTDLPEAEEIVQRNIDAASSLSGRSVRFRALDWDAELSSNIQSSLDHIDMIIAADCTYNSDSR